MTESQAQIVDPAEAQQQPMDVDTEPETNRTTTSVTPLPMPTPTTLPRPPSLGPQKKDKDKKKETAEDVADSKQVQDLLEDDLGKVERPMKVDSGIVVPIPDFSVPVVYEKQAIYTPRIVQSLFSRKDAGAGDSDVTVPVPPLDEGRARPWIGADRNLTLYEPPFHPLLFPPAGTGFNVPETDDSVNPTISPFGIPLSESLPRIPSTEEAAQQRSRRLDELVPLESAYAGTLHPLPSGVVNSLGKRGHRHHHHHHRRDRRRSSVGGAGEPATTSTGAAGGVQPTTSSANAQTVKVASSVMIPGTSAYALPPAYATNRKMGAMSFDQIQAQNEELSHQRAGQGKDREEVDLVELGVGFTVNPVARMIKRNNKCMMSRDWKTVWREIQFTRALERVEQLKDEGAWSFRQMKKFRGPPLSGGKSHWDWLLDEMRWMQADFKEERRWKIVLAQEMAQEVRRWHKASDVDRARMMVGGRGWGHKRYHNERRDGSGDGMDVDEDADGAQRIGQANEAEGADEVLEGIMERDRDVEVAKEHIQEAGKAEQPVEKPKEEADDDAEGEEDGDGEPDEDAEGEKDEEDEDAAGEVDDEMAFPDTEDAVMSEFGEGIEERLHGMEVNTGTSSTLQLKALILPSGTERSRP
jgi:hypothetical protein